MAKRAPTLILLAVTTALLGGCVKFGAKPPASLLTVESAAQVAPGTKAQPAAGVVTIIEPDVPRALQTTRVAVRVDDASFAYVPKAFWVDTPRNLFRSILAETVEARDGVLVLDSGQFSAAPGQRVAGDLLDFGIDARAHKAVVTFDAVVIGNTGVTAKQRFTATAPVGSINPEGSAHAINQAANAVAVQVADWLKTVQ